MSRFESGLCAALCVMGVGVTPLVNATPVYAFTALSELDGPLSIAVAINETGQVVGHSYTTGVSSERR